MTTTILDKNQILKEKFGYDSFRGRQADVIDSVLSGKDTVCIAPTGAGKSLNFQVPSLMLDGLTIVVSPLIALMKDQVDTLVSKGLPSTFINSSLGQSDYSERLNMVIAGKFKILYVSPERFSNSSFMGAMSTVNVSLFAIDECHCVSQWGHDFRPDYLRLAKAINAFNRPPVIALTATATPEVREDVVKQLELREPNVFVSGFERENLTLGVEFSARKEMKFYRVMKDAKKWETGIIYCSTRRNVEALSRYFKSNKIKHVSYHGGMKEDDRNEIQNKFMSGNYPVVIATNAFGMGIDRSDLRFVTHLDIPGSVEAYYQEAGRAGRDGLLSHCRLLYDASSVATQQFFIDGANPTRDIVQKTYDKIIFLCGVGSINMTVEEISEELSGEVRNGMAVGGALKLLDRHKGIRRWYESGRRGYFTAVNYPIKKIEDFNIDFASLNAKRMRDYDRLDEVKAYAENYNQCRQGFILDYFGEKSRNCGRCDVCESKK